MENVQSFEINGESFVIDFNNTQIQNALEILQNHN